MSKMRTINYTKVIHPKVIKTPIDIPMATIITKDTPVTVQKFSTVTTPPYETFRVEVPARIKLSNLKYFWYKHLKCMEDEEIVEMILSEHLNK